MDSLRKKNLPRRALGSTTPIKPASPSPRRFTFIPPEEGLFSGPTHIISAQERRPPRRRGVFLRILLWTFPIVALVTLFALGYISWKVGSATRSMSIVPQENALISDTMHGATSLLTPILHRARAPLPGERDGRTNILLLGKANEKTAGQNLTDTIMIVSFDFSRKKIALLSLPRDLYVQIPGTQTFTKLNALYQLDRGNDTEADTVKQAVSIITGLPIHAFATLDYDGFINIVNLVGGVSVYVDQDLFDPHFPGPNYSYETFAIKKGWQDLDGATALKYVRERHSDPEGDFGRAKRQQTILSAIKKKAFSLKTILNPIAISDIIDTLGTHIRTDLSLENMQSLIGLADEFDTTNISTAVVDAWKKDSLLRVSHVPVGSVAMFVLLPRTGDWSETRELARNIFDLDATKSRQEAINAEDAHISIINRSNAPSLGPRVMRFLSDNLHIKHVSVVPAASSVPPDTTANNTIDTSGILRRKSTEALYTTDEIATKLSLQTLDPNTLSIYTLPEEDAASDIFIFLGNDLAKRLSFEEDTIDDIQKAEGDPEYQKQLDEALASEKK